jgi:hypothetical protein
MTKPCRPPTSTVLLFASCYAIQIVMFDAELDLEDGP